MMRIVGRTTNVHALRDPEPLTESTARERDR
jgi:hypothetical protein